MSTSGALSSAALQRKHLFFFHQKKWHHFEETGSTWNHRYLSKALLNLQIIADLCAQTEPWLFICQYLVIVFFFPPHHFSAITASLTVKAWIFSVKEIFLIVTTRKIQTVLLKSQSSYRCRKVLLHVCGASQMDRCCLARERAAISLMEWILPLSENRALRKTNSRKRCLNSNRGNACITPPITHLAALWDKAWACNQGCHNASINSGEEFLGPKTAAHYLLFTKTFRAND